MSGRYITAGPDFITEGEFFEYLKCPLRYDLLRNRKIETEEMPSFSKQVGAVAKGFMLSIFNGSIDSVSKVKKRWDKSCERYSTSQQKCIEGMGLLNQFCRWCQKEQIIVDGIDLVYEIPLDGPHGRINLGGRIEYVVHTPAKMRHMILRPDFGSRMPEQNLLDMQMKNAMDSMGFRTVYRERIGTLVHYVRNDRDFFTMQFEDEERRMAAAVNNVAFAIKNKLFYPRETILCQSCRIKSLCRMWRG